MAKSFYELNYRVYAVCRYKSLSLKNYCKRILCVNFDEIEKINNFIYKIDNKDRLEYLIGSGFAELLKKDPYLYPVLNRGNGVKLHKRINSESFFFDLKKKNINTPKWSFRKPITKNFLIKDFKSFGGCLVEKYDKEKKLKKNQYYQKIIEGEHISVQFFCKNKQMRILSICNQFFKKNTFHPFIIESIISKKVSSRVLIKLSEICNNLCSLYNLNGINNLDLVLESKTQKIFVIEMNARPGLSTNMIFKIHRNLFKDSFIKKEYSNPKYYYGTQILYSKKRILINEKSFKFIKSFEFNNYFSELPANNELINMNQPICLIHQKSKKNQILRDKLKKISYKFISNLGFIDGQI